MERPRVWAAAIQFLQDHVRPDPEGCVLSPIEVASILADAERGVVKIGDVHNLIASLMESAGTDWILSAWNEVKDLREMPYDEYLRTEHWQEVREAARRRANERCQLCNRSGQLDVHHRTYERRGCEQDSDVTVLCRRCHSKFHGKELPALQAPGG